MDRETLEAMTVAELHKLADKRGIAVPSKAKKADLVDAISEADGDTPAATTTAAANEKPTVPAGSIDPVVAAAREERLAERPPPPGRVRPQPAAIDERLVDRRQKRLAAREDGEQPARATPARPGRREL